MSPQVEEILWWIKSMLQDAARGEDVSPLTVLDWVKDLEHLLQEDEMEAGHVYHDPSGRQITVLGRDGLFPDSRLLVQREDGQRWSVDRQRLAAKKEVSE